MENDLPEFPTGRIYRGEVVAASYGDPGVACYRGHPLIEALPPILTVGQAIKGLAHYPEYAEAERAEESHIRLHLIDNALDMFIPLSIHVDLEQRLSRVIRGGYKDRNPLRPEFWREMKARLRTSHDFVPRDRSLKRTRGFNIIGTSGGGKTTSLQSVLSLYPQAIIHGHYGGQDFIFSQLVWLQLQCPFDGNPRSVCMNFFKAVDDILGTGYHAEAKRGRQSLGQLMLEMKGVASVHCLGVLVIDDIEHLSTAKSGGAEALLNFFVQLANTIGVPVLLVSTFKALPILTREFRQIRRGTGQGDMVWDRMLYEWEDGPGKRLGEWQLFLKKLWKYQYVRKPSPLTRELSETLYYETQGITDFVVKVFMLAQVRAITTGLEEITPKLVESVAGDCLRLAQPVLRVLRRVQLGLATVQDLTLVDDIHRIDLEPFFKQARRELKRRRESEEPPEPDGGQAEDADAADADDEPEADAEDEPGADEQAPPPPGRRAPKKRAGRRAGTVVRATGFDADDLRNALPQGGARADGLYKSLRRAGYVGSSGEYYGAGAGL